MTTPRPRKLSLTDRYHVAHLKAEMLAFRIAVKAGDFAAAKAALASAFADSAALEEK